MTVGVSLNTTPTVHCKTVTTTYDTHTFNRFLKDCNHNKYDHEKKSHIRWHGTRRCILRHSDRMFVVTLCAIDKNIL